MTKIIQAFPGTQVWHAYDADRPDIVTLLIEISNHPPGAETPPVLRLRITKTDLKDAIDAIKRTPESVRMNNWDGHVEVPLTGFASVHRQSFRSILVYQPRWQLDGSLIRVVDRSFRFKRCRNHNGWPDHLDTVAFELSEIEGALLQEDDGPILMCHDRLAFLAEVKSLRLA
jgi:hypothetical protein